MKKLKLLCVLLCIIMLALIFGVKSPEENTQIRSETSSGDKEKPSTSSAAEKTAQNKGGNVIKHDGYLYYVVTNRGSGDTFSNKICRKNLNDQSEEVVFNAEQYKIGDRMIIFKDKIFFNMTEKTYYIDLKTRNYLEEYIDGILYSIIDEKLIYATNTAIYKADYYEKTYALKKISQVTKTISSLIGEDDDNLYFIGDNTGTIFAINKKTQTLKNIDASSKNLKFVNLLISNKYLYALFKDSNENILEIHKIRKSDMNITKIKHTDDDVVFSFVLKNELYFSDKTFTNLYKISENSDKIEKTDMPKNASNYYEVKLEDKNVNLYKNNEKLVAIKKGIDGEKVQTDKIEIVDDYIYVKINIMQGEKIISTELWRLKEDGTNLEELK